MGGSSGYQPPPDMPPPPASELDPTLQIARDRARLKRKSRQGLGSTLLTGPLGFKNQNLSTSTLRPPAMAGFALGLTSKTALGSPRGRGTT